MYRPILHGSKACEASVRGDVSCYNHNPVTVSYLSITGTRPEESSQA
jgi:hypothetical protein